MKLGSLFDGSGGFPLAGQMCGIEPVWASEIEPYPIAVTKNRFPFMKHYGDISKINGAEIEPVDIITFGSPCQDLSVAGKRAGLKHEANGDDETTRSGLFMEAVRIIKEMREATNGIYPRFALWENVPGAFSSNKGEDFRIVLEELIKIVEPSAVMPAVPKKGWNYFDSYCGDGWSLAYRTFDAQWWGVPQRRRRIHLVCDFRGECAGKVLFEREGLRGHSAESGAEREEASRNAENGIGAADREGKGESNITAYSFDSLSSKLATNNDQYLFQPISNILLDDQGGQQISVRTDGKCSTLRAEMHGNVPCIIGADIYNLALTGDVVGSLTAEGHTSTGSSPKVMVAYSIENHPADSRVNIDDSGKAQTLTSRKGTGGGNVPLVMEPTYCLQGNGIDQADTAGCNGKGWRENESYTLNTVDRPAVVYAFDRAAFNQGINAQYDFEVTDSGINSTLVAKGPSGVAYSCDEKCGNTYTWEEQANTLAAKDYKQPQAVAYEEKTTRYIVRRLTPTECARLQGFPDWWGHIKPKEDFTDEEYAFWLDVRNTHAEINGKTVKEYTKKQMLTWYNKLHTDSAEYKCWGNGIALPPALYCVQGIVEVLRERVVR